MNYEELVESLLLQGEWVDDGCLEIVLEECWSALGCCIALPQLFISMWRRRQ